MSTWLYLQCLDHDPVLTAEDESGQHLYDLPQIRKDIKRKESLVLLVATPGFDWDSLTYFRRRTVRFLVQHPRCRIGIIDEYGATYPVEETIQKPSRSNQ